MIKDFDYTIYKNFKVKYQKVGFENISREDPFIIEMESQLDQNQQFFYVADVVRLKILFVSQSIRKIIGINSDEFDLSTFLSRTHSDDQKRYALARSKMINLGQELFIKQGGEAILSSHFRQLNSENKYFNLLFQGYMFYNEVPKKTVYVILVLTDLSKLKINKNGYHFYVGNDMNLFQYPNAELLQHGHVYSDREFEILKLIATGLDSEQIAEKLYLSVNTVNTHRRNILKKTNKTSTHELVIELQERGVL